MPKFFNFYDPLERRYVFNSFLVVVVVVEVMILIFTLIWQIDEGALGGPVRVVPFPWKEYLLVSFAAPIALVFIFGIIVRGFQAMSPGEESPDSPEGPPSKKVSPLRISFFFGVATLLVLLAFLLFGGKILYLLNLPLRALGLGGTYLLVALLALVCLYFPLRLILNYRLQKKALEYRYLQYLAERHGLVLTDLQNPDNRRKAETMNAPEERPLLDSSENATEDSSS